VIRQEDMEAGASTRGVETAEFVSTVVGLLTHSVADGIALGASTTRAGQQEKGRSLALMIFLAIMVHKAPAAFGMVTVLLGAGVRTPTVRRFLLAFSLAAPLGALATWAALALLHRLAPAPAPDQTTQWWIGITLLFSAGTFLFVATHALQASSSSSPPFDPCCPLPPHSLPPPNTHVNVSPLITCLLMASGFAFPALLTAIVGDLHHH